MIYLYGASGHAKVILEIFESLGHSEFTFIDDFSNNTSLLNFPIIKAAAVPNQSANPNKLLISIGNNSIRKTIAEQYDIKTFISAVHPTSSVSKRSIIGSGTVVMSNVSINASSEIGNHCIINTNASIDHDCKIEDYVHLSPNVALAGNVIVGEGTHIGIGASVIQGIKIGKWATIGAGAVIINDIPDYAVVVGNPGKIIKYTNS